MARYCMICGHELITSGNDMMSNVIGIDLAENEDAMVTYAHCPDCGCEYQMRDASNNDTIADPRFIGSCNLFGNNEEETNV